MSTVSWVIFDHILLREISTYLSRLDEPLTVNSLSWMEMMKVKPSLLKFVRILPFWVMSKRKISLGVSNWKVNDVDLIPVGVDGVDSGWQFQMFPMMYCDSLLFFQCVKCKGESGWLEEMNSRSWWRL